MKKTILALSMVLFCFTACKKDANMVSPRLETPSEKTIEAPRNVDPILFAEALSKLQEGKKGTAGNPVMFLQTNLADKYAKKSKYLYRGSVTNAAGTISFDAQKNIISPDGAAALLLFSADTPDSTLAYIETHHINTFGTPSIKGFFMLFTKSISYPGIQTLYAQVGQVVVCGDCEMDAKAETNAEFTFWLDPNVASTSVINVFIQPY